MMNDNKEGDLVRVVDYNPDGTQATCSQRYGVTITDQERTTVECGRYEHRENAIIIADAIRHAITEARNETLAQIEEVILEGIAELKENIAKNVSQKRKF